MNIQSELVRLNKLRMPELHAEYMRLHGEEARSNNRIFLVKRLAWKLQSMAEGGLSERARAKAAELAAGREIRVRPPAGVHVAASAVVDAPATAELVPGTTLTRDWRGQRLVVHVTDRGVEWNGRTFSSLTAAAKAITGASWNGRLFFGLGPRRAS
jgi:hypothetical protein